MSDNFIKPKHTPIGDIQWGLLEDGIGKVGKASGMKIEYSMSDEMDFAKKLSLKMRKQFMRQLLQEENEMHQQELNSIRRLHSHDTVCEEVRKCARGQIKEKRKYVNNAQESHLGKLFRIYYD